MSNQIKIRASRLPIHEHCAASAHTDDCDVVHNSVSMPAEQGTEVHRISLDGEDSIVKRGYRPDDWDKDVDPKFDLDELGRLTYWFEQIWKEVHPMFGNPLFEYAMESDRLTGHADIIGFSNIEDSLSDDEGAIIVTPATAHIADLKSGRLTDGDHSAQLKGYGWLIMQEYPFVEEVYGYIYWLQDTTQIPYPAWTREYLNEWMQGVFDRIDNWDGKSYTSGNHCHFCPREQDCPDRRRMEKTSVSAIMQSDEAGLPVKDEDVIQLYYQKNLIKQKIVLLENAIRYRAIQSPIIGDTKMLSITESNPRELDPIKAFNILKFNDVYSFTDEELASVTTVSASKAEKLVGERYVEGKGQAKKDLAQALKDGGALTTKTQLRMSIKNKPKELQ